MGVRAGGGRLNGDPPLAALLAGPVLPAAQGLLGCQISAGGVSVRLTEVEAYGGVGADPASHAHRGPTPRNQVMFGPPGHLYLYLTYGRHWCANVVCGPATEAAAVLLRAGEVTDGLALARTRRRTARGDQELARGPARLSSVLGLDRAANGAYLLDGAGPVRLVAAAPAVAPAQTMAGPRVGVRAGRDDPGGSGSPVSRA